MAFDTKPYIIPVFIPHAGCPHQCLFCDQRHTTGMPAEIPTADGLHQEVTTYLNYRRDADTFTEIAFFGGNFLGLPQHDRLALLTLAAGYVDSGAVNGIRFSTRPDTVTGNRLSDIAPFPVTTIEIGAQSMDDAVLHRNGRGHTAEDTRKAVRLIRDKTTCRLGIQMMVGMVDDTLDKLALSADHIVDLGPDFVRIYPLLVLKDSPLEKLYHNGQFQPLTVDVAVARTRIVYQKFKAHGIRVIRMGLQPTAELNPQAAVVAGPFHPAFGELVLGAFWYGVIETGLKDQRHHGGPIRIVVNPRNISRVKGQKKRNIEQLRLAFQTADITVTSDAELPMESLIVNDVHYRL